MLYQLLAKTIYNGEFFMKIEQFTEKAREAISEANELAKQYNHSQIEAEHLLAPPLAQEGGVVQQIIQKVGGNLATAQRMVTSDLERLPRVYGGSEPGIAPPLGQLLENDWHGMGQLPAEYHSLWHMVLALFAGWKAPRHPAL